MANKSVSAAKSSASDCKSEPFGAHLKFARPILRRKDTSPNHIALRKAHRGFDKQRGFADAGVAANEHQRAGHNAAA